MKLLNLSITFLVFVQIARFSEAETRYSKFCNFNEFQDSNKSKSCFFDINANFLLCKNGTHNKWIGGSKVETLVLCDLPDLNFNPKLILQKFPNLKHLTIAYSNLTTLQSFPVETSKKLKKIEIVNTKLQKIGTNCFSKLLSLKDIDLRNNTLESITPSDLNSSSLQKVYLYGNKWKCDSSMEWLLESEIGSLANKVMDKHKLDCFHPHEGRPLVPVMEVIKSLKQECEESVCECQLTYVIGKTERQTQRQLMAFALMNCSHRGLTEMPSFLPANISALYLVGNKISDLSPLKTNPYYKRILDIYLDDNSIESISDIDGTYWLEHFRLLSLRGNKLTALPTYALESVLQHSTNAVSLFLGNNPWTCDCSFTPGFQELLIRYPKLVKDINDVKCAFSEDDENSDKQIRDLTRTEICVTPGDYWIYPLDILNVILCLIIIFVLGKFLYDYRSFKKSGKLPWIVNRIP